jgi:type I restriction enzyme S subunit
VQIEKQSLLEAGSIKKDVSLSPIPKDEKPFILPANWEWVRGQDISMFVTSGSRGWAKYYSSSGAIFIRIGNLDYGKIDLDLESLQFVKPPEGAEGTRTRVSCNDILVSITGDTGMRHRLTWLLLFAMLWSLLIVFWFSGSVWEVKKSLSYL